MNSPYEIESNSTNTIDMLSGFPSKSSLMNAAKILKKASSELFDIEIENEAPRLIYARTEDVTPVLEIVAKFLSEQYQDQVLASNLMFTGGASSGFVYLWTHLLPHDRKVIVATPTYQLLLNCLVNDLKYEIESVPENEEGLDLDVLEVVLKREYDIHGSRSEFCSGIYIIPTFSNPTGKLYSEAFSKRLVELAAQYNVLVVCDDVYNQFYTTEHPPKRIISYETTNQGHVVSNGSFSKFITPALRLGWIEAHPPLIDKMQNWGLLQSLNCLGQLSALIISIAITSGDITRHITVERENIKARHKLAQSFLKENLNKNLKISKSLGGFFIWIQLPDHFPLPELVKKCAAEDVLFLPGYIHMNIGPGNYMRISISRADDLNKLRSGLEIICANINKLM